MAQPPQPDFQKKSSPSPVAAPSQAMAPRPFPPQVDVAAPDVQAPDAAAPDALTLDSAPAFPKLNFQIRAAGGSPPPLQPKLTIGAPNDPYEQEADRVAAQVVQRIHSPAANLPTENRTYQAQSVQRQAWPEQPILQMKSTLQRETLLDEDDELQMKPMIQRLELSEDDELQMKPMPQRSAMPPGVKLQMKSAFSEGVIEGDASPDLEDGIQRARGNGQALAPTLQMQMGQAMGADFSGVRVHTDTQSDQLSRSIQAKAFTTGQDIFFRQGAYQPGSRGGQELIAHELTHVVQQNGRSVQRSLQPSKPVQKHSTAKTLSSSNAIHIGRDRLSSAASDIIFRYTDVPDKDTWKADSKIDYKKRSNELKLIDDCIERFDAIRNSDDKKAEQRSLLYDIKLAIHQWETKKAQKGHTSVRQGFVDNLKSIIDIKIQSISDAHAIELAPLVAEYLQAVTERNMNLTQQKGGELYDQHYELFQTTVTDALKTTDRAEWATIFFAAPHKAVGAGQLTSMTIKGIADYSWMTKKQADEAITRFILPHAAQDHENQIMQMLQYTPFRNALKLKATPQIYADLQEKMPIVRISDAAEDDIATKDQPSITDVADSVFAMFLGDQPNTGLGYATNSAEFSTANFLLGNTTDAARAPCMTLSNILTEVFKAVLPSGVPGAFPVQDMRPMLTKPLAGIGTGTGILTRETTFHGNVQQWGNIKGYATVNRIFFGDGHEWLQVGNKEYDPTLGISGPVGTIAAQLEALTFVKKGDKYKASNGQTVTRNNRVPPGGANLLFTRSIVIKP